MTFGMVALWTVVTVLIIFDVVMMSGVRSLVRDFDAMGHGRFGTSVSPPDRRQGPIDGTLPLDVYRDGRVLQSTLGSTVGRAGAVLIFLRPNCHGCEKLMGHLRAEHFGESVGAGGLEPVLVMSGTMPSVEIQGFRLPVVVDRTGDVARRLSVHGFPYVIAVSGGLEVMVHGTALSVGEMRMMLLGLSGERVVSGRKRIHAGS